MMEIKYLELKKITAMHGEEIQEAVRKVVYGGWYLQGASNRKFEEQYADYCHANYCVGCANGLDALTLSLRSLMEMGEMSGRRGDCACQHIYRNDTRHHRKPSEGCACGASYRHFPN